MRLQLHQRLEAVAVIEPVPPVRRRDWVFTALLALAGIATVALEVAIPVWARIVPAALAVGFIPFRRRIPLIAITSVSVATAVCVALALRGSEVVDVLAPAGLAGVVLVYSLCRWATPLHIGIGFIANIGSEMVIEWSAGDPQSENWILLVPWLVVAGFALAMRYRARAIAGQHEQVRLAERNALARELHDTVAHHVTAIAVQAQAGQYVIESDPATAAEALRSIETIANNSIAEMRRMVGVLRNEGDQVRTLAPDTLDVLAVSDSQPIIHVSGDVQLDQLPAEVGAALFRVAQESITNARNHSRNVTFVDVAVKHHADHVHMAVENDGTPTTRNSGSGYGQVGMRERVEALGGAFESSARPANGWRTTTSIPLTKVTR